MLASALTVAATSLVTAATGGAESGGGIPAPVVGVGVFLLLTAVMVGLLMFGAGRDHT